MKPKRVWKKRDRYRGDLKRSRLNNVGETACGLFGVELAELREALSPEPLWKRALRARGQNV